MKANGFLVIIAQIESEVARLPPLYYLSIALRSAKCDFWH